MKTESFNKKSNEVMILLLEQLKEVNNKLSRFFKLIPEESLKGYKNREQIKKAHRNALDLYPYE
ncbi:MAG: hypothetical protein HYT63_00415 [Candidatus Yanofskybacteria bacterium]|nr:hypothetical protein [Candidatus Yanofskybacteria bacterium]